MDIEICHQNNLYRMPTHYMLHTSIVDRKPLLRCELDVFVPPGTTSNVQNARDPKLLFLQWAYLRNSCNRVPDAAD